MNKLTKLDAVNRILRGAGEAPVSSLDEAPLNENLIAEQILDETLLSEQMHGIAWNTISSLHYPDETTRRILLPPNLLQVEAWGKDAHCHYIEKYDPSDGLYYLYNPAEETYEFPEPVFLRIVTKLDFEALPVQVQFQVTDLAAHYYQEVTVGDRAMSAVLQSIAAMSRAKGRAADWRSKRLNQFQHGRSNDPRNAARRVRRPR